MMVLLKLPLAFACYVIWYAVRADPDRLEPAALVPSEPEPCPWRPPRRPRTPHPPRRRVSRATARA